MAKIKIDLDRRIASIDRKIYGQFIEHLGRCIYGGIYDEGSDLSDEEGFRKDVLDAARDLKVPILRWPGGNFVSGYHWMDGIGPKDFRPQKFDLAWFNEESNRFGTDEFVAYCQKLGVEPYICVNMGNGTAEEAAAWVEYCNGAADTHYARLRRKGGKEETYGVKYWGLGNEVYGRWQIGHKNAEDYAKEALEFAKVMKWVDPSIKLIACGANDPDWDRTVLEKLIDIVDYISIHFYVGRESYYDTLASTEMVERRIKLLESAIQIAASKTRDMGEIKIAVDEWNVWYRVHDGRDRDHRNKLEERYNLRDALCIASFLNVFHRCAKSVRIANMAQMVNVIAPIFTSREGMFLQTIYFPLKLYAHHCGDVALDPYVESDVFSSEHYGLKDVPYLDVSATLGQADGTLSIAVVNRHKDDPIETSVELPGIDVKDEAQVFEINGNSPDVENSFERSDSVGITEKNLRGISSQFKYAFPAHSVTLIKLWVT